jgi:hypothetical protein
MAADDEKPVAVGYANLERGRWYACIRFMRDGKRVGEPIVCKNEPQLEVMAAAALAHRYARRINAGESPDAVLR